MILIFLLVTNISISPEYYTNTNYYYEVVGKDSIIYGATNGGLVAYNYLNGTFKVLTNTDGLQTNRQSCLALDSSEYIWVGNEFGLALVSQDFSNIYIYPDEYLVSTITQVITCSKDSIYIGSPSGFLFIDTKGTPADFSDDTRIKLYEIDLPSGNVLSIALDSAYIWVGTDEGLARFTKDFNPDSTQQYTTSHGLLSNHINKIAIIDTSIYVATDSGLNLFQSDHFDTLLSGYEINDINYIGDSLVLALDQVSQIAFYYEGNLTVAQNGLPYRCKVFSLADVNSNLFCGLGNRYVRDYYGEGIGRYDFGNNVWSITKNKCMPSNHISEITANEYGIFIACGARSSESRGFGWLNNNGAWINFSTDSILPSNHIHRCVTAPDKKVWFGINAFPDDTSEVMVFSFDLSNNEWNFIRNRYNNMEGTVAIWDIEFDNNNNMYLALAGPSDKLWVIDSALNTVYFLGDRRTGFNVEIAVDSAGKIWRTVTGAEGGLIMIDTKNTLFDRSDDYFRTYTESDGLLSKYAFGCTVDKNNNFYVANEIGLLIHNDTGFSGITDFSEEEVLDVELDSEGRVWIMTRDGIYYYDPVFNIISGWTYSEINVHIEFVVLSNEIIQIQGFEFDPLRRCFWIGGETGLLKLAVQIDTLPELDSVLIYPNPVLDKNIVRIRNIPLDAQVNIYAISGRLIAENLLPDEVFGEIVWEIPEDIGSGLYFALIKSDRGNKVCKFAIVR